MFKIFKSKKGSTNTLTILAILITIQVISAVLITYINAEYGTSGESYNVDNIKDNALQETENINILSGGVILLNVIKLSIWDVGNTLKLPFWLDIFFTLVTIMILFTGFRMIFPGGGG